ncbi:DUF3085 domain-containing protein, partial [Klebsiella michiganensis]|uniref:DUF3085 domain-containing protein n=1 Tax=Klebsiella michiganensis TaxID=1134687 RepID=UPI0013D08D6D
DEVITDPGIVLVKDEGVYVISSGLPHDAVDDEGRLFVAYAEGFNPKKDDEVRSRQQAFSGDDFAEYMPIDRRLFDAL